MWSKQYYKKQKFPNSWKEKKVFAKQQLEIPISCLNHGKISIANSQLLSRVKILSENTFIVALDKSEKIHSHPLSYGEEDNVLSILLAQGRNDLMLINQLKYDRGLLYRLDYETSGLLLYAKTDAVYQMVRENFSKIMIKKYYRLKCQGKLKLSHGIWEHALDSHLTKSQKMRVMDNNLVNARLSYELISYNDVNDESEVLVNLHTGLRHQIRAQFSHEGHSIIGDLLYGGRNAQRLYLHAQEYHVYLPVLNGQAMIFKAPFPKNW